MHRWFRPIASLLPTVLLQAALPDRRSRSGTEGIEGEEVAKLRLLSSITEELVRDFNANVFTKAGFARGTLNLVPPRAVLPDAVDKHLRPEQMQRGLRYSD